MAETHGGVISGRNRPSARASGRDHPQAGRAASTHTLQWGARRPAGPVARRRRRHRLAGSRVRDGRGGWGALMAMIDIMLS